jgi:2-dehydro-3-deoxyphosphooctonate aldolase (KDO 8-P synthase)
MIKGHNQFFLIAGPCAVESEEICFTVAEKLLTICQPLGIPLIFKGSYRKANRTKLDSFQGIGDEKALNILKKVNEQFHLPTLTDVHESHECAMAANYVDVLQIPAFLCRQTDLLIAAAKTGKIVNIKKGQFVSAKTMEYAVEKIRNSGNLKVILTERGTTFGYNDLIVDYRNIPWMQEAGCPVVLDITHSLQQPNQSSGVTGGRPQLVETIAKAGIAAGVDGLFLETHPNPKEAKSDGANMIHLDQVEKLLKKLVIIRNAYLETLIL